jgi:DMSO/TMAO reductase YedYZ molybdopterin-dependent catalytic subunit
MAGADPHDEPAWIHGHPHEPNPLPPGADASLILTDPGGNLRRFTVDDLRRLPYREAYDCYIVSTGHGASGPFTFGGVPLAGLLAAALPELPAWQWVDVVSADGFGVRLARKDLYAVPDTRPILLAYSLDGSPLTRERGLVRLVVPSEVDDALRQVKWVSRIDITA